MTGMTGSHLDSLTVRTLDAVDIRLDLAGLGSRSYAYLIDWHIRIAAALAWFLSAGLIADALGMMGLDLERFWSTRALFVFWPAFLIYALYHPLLEVWMKGRTPGKRIAGIRIVASDGGMAGVGGLLIRNIFRIIDGLPMLYGVGIVVMLGSKRQLRIGDMAGGTLLVHDDGQQRDKPSMVADDALLSMRQLDLAEELLARWFQLEPESRYSLARQLMAGSPDPAVQRQAERLGDADLKRALEDIVQRVSA